MDEPTWIRTGQAFSGPMLGRRKTSSVSRKAAMRALGSVVYAARLGDGTIKFGWTEHFDERLHWLSGYTKQDVELLAFRLGTYEDEQAIHATLIPHRADFTEQSREYYHPVAEVMSVVNDMRSALNMPPVAA